MDEILCSETTHRAIAPFFRTEALGSRTLKGLPDAVACFCIEALGEARSAFEVELDRGLTPQVGRRAELATLEAYLTDAGRGQARLVTLAGAPGTGKTRLIHELVVRARHRGFTLLRGQCQSYTSVASRCANNWPIPRSPRRSKPSMSHVMAGRFEAAAGAIDRALPQLRAADGGNAAGYGYALGHLALMAGDRGEFERAESLLRDARVVVEQSGRYALSGALAVIEGMVLSFRGDWPGCQRAANRVREVAERIDGSYQRQMAAALDGLAAFYGSGDGRGIASIRRAALFLESRGMGLTLSWNFAVLAEVLALAGHAEEARARTRTARSRAARSATASDRRRHCAPKRCVRAAKASRRKAHCKRASTRRARSRARARNS